MKLECNEFEMDREVTAREAEAVETWAKTVGQKGAGTRLNLSERHPSEGTLRSPVMVLTTMVKASLKVVAAGKFSGEKPENISSKGSASVLIKLHRWTRLAFLQGTMTTGGEKIKMSGCWNWILCVSLEWERGGGLPGQRSTLVCKKT